MAAQHQPNNIIIYLMADNSAIKFLWRHFFMNETLSDFIVIPICAVVFVASMSLMLIFYNLTKDQNEIIVIDNSDKASLAVTYNEKEDFVNSDDGEMVLITGTNVYTNITSTLIAETEEEIKGNELVFVIDNGTDTYTTTYNDANALAMEIHYKEKTALNKVKSFIKMNEKYERQYMYQAEEGKEKARLVAVKYTLK